MECFCFVLMIVYVTIQCSTNMSPFNVFLWCLPSFVWKTIREQHKKRQNKCHDGYGYLSSPFLFVFCVCLIETIYWFNFRFEIGFLERNEQKLNSVSLYSVRERKCQDSWPSLKCQNRTENYLNDIKQLSKFQTDCQPTSSCTKILTNLSLKKFKQTDLN